MGAAIWACIGVICAGWLAFVVHEIHYLAHAPKETR